MDCQTARLLLDLHRGGPDDLPADDHAALDAHLAGCGGCQGFAAAQAGFDAALAAAVRNVPLPAGGQERAYAAAAARRSAVVRRRWLAGLAAAVGVGLAVPAGYVGFLRTRPAVDTAALSEAFDRRRDDPERFAADWLRDRGLPPVLPHRFDYRHLHDAVLADLGGRPTPCVQFVRGPDSLRVFVLTRTQFRLTNLQPAQGSFATVQPIPEGPDHPGVAYLLLYTSPTLDPFLQPAQ